MFQMDGLEGLLERFDWVEGIKWNNEKQIDWE